MRLHLLGIPHTVTTKDFAHCAFTQNAFCVDIPLRDFSRTLYNSAHHTGGELYFQG